MPTTRRFSSFAFASKNLGTRCLQHLLPDIARKIPAYQRRGRFSWPEAGQFRLVLERFRDLAGLGLDRFGGNRDLKLVLTTFN